MVTISSEATLSGGTSPRSSLILGVKVRQKRGRPIACLDPKLPLIMILYSIFSTVKGVRAQ